MVHICLHGGEAARVTAGPLPLPQALVLGIRQLLSLGVGRHSLRKVVLESDARLALDSGPLHTRSESVVSCSQTRDSGRRRLTTVSLNRRCIREPTPLNCTLGSDTPRMQVKADSGYVTRVEVTRHELTCPFEPLAGWGPRARRSL